MARLDVDLATLRTAFGPAGLTIRALVASRLIERTQATTRVMVVWCVPSPANHFRKPKLLIQLASLAFIHDPNAVIGESMNGRPIFAKNAYSLLPPVGKVGPHNHWVVMQFASTESRLVDRLQAFIARLRTDLLMRTRHNPTSDTFQLRVNKRPFVTPFPLWPGSFDLREEQGEVDDAIIQALADLERTSNAGTQ